MPSFAEDVAAAVEVLGVRAAGVVWGIGTTDWESPEQRDEFLALISQKG